MCSHVELTIPDLGMPEANIIATEWLVPVGGRVYEGDRVLEILAGEVTVDIGAPASGQIVEHYVHEDEPVRVGQVVAKIDVDDG